VQVTNSTFANAGNVRANNLGNGRAIDFRNVSIDSARIENCSFFNMSDRVFRHFGAGQVPMKNLTVNHNTIFNELAEHGCIGLGKVDGVIRITNNLFVDNFIFGNDSTATERLGEFGDTDERGPSGAYRMTFVGTMKDTVTSTSYFIRNNYYSVSPSLQAFYDSRNGLPECRRRNLIPLTWYISGKLGADSVKAFTKVATPIAFTKAPPTAVAMAEWFFLRSHQAVPGRSSRMQPSSRNTTGNASQLRTSRILSISPIKRLPRRILALTEASPSEISDGGSWCR